jgi:hypothetical protein
MEILKQSAFGGDEAEAARLATKWRKKLHLGDMGTLFFEPHQIGELLGFYRNQQTVPFEPDEMADKAQDDDDDADADDARRPWQVSKSKNKSARGKKGSKEGGGFWSSAAGTAVLYGAVAFLSASAAAAVTVLLVRHFGRKQD